MYVADWQVGMRVLDATNPADLVEVGAYEWLGLADDLSVVGSPSLCDPEGKAG